MQRKGAEKIASIGLFEGAIVKEGPHWCYTKEGCMHSPVT